MIMDDKTQEEIKGKETQSSETSTTPSGTDDSKDRNTTEDATKTPLIDDANLAAKRMEDANKEKKELLDREEELMAKRALGGVTEAGQATVAKIETDEEYTARFERGEVNPMKNDAEQNTGKEGE